MGRRIAAFIQSPDHTCPRVLPVRKSNVLPSKVCELGFPYNLSFFLWIEFSNVIVQLMAFHEIIIFIQFLTASFISGHTVDDFLSHPPPSTS